MYSVLLSLVKLVSTALFVFTAEVLAIVEWLFGFSNATEMNEKSGNAS